MNAHSPLRIVATSLIAMVFLVACDTASEQTSAAQEALEELQKKYDELVEEKLDDPVQWAADDFENIGDWDYQALDISYTSPDDLAAQLNVLGDEKYEVIWMERTPDGFLVVAKKPSVSYLSRIPLSKIGSLIIGAGDGSE